MKTRPLSYRATALSFVWLIGALGCAEPVDEPECACDAERPQLTHQTNPLAIAGRWEPSSEAEASGQSASVPVTEAGPWQGESVSCSGTFTEGAQRVRDWLFAHWPQVSDVQGYSCRAINGNPNVTSIHAVGRALDIFIPLDGGEADNDLGDPIANYLMEHADEIGVQRVIWDRTSWTAGRSSREYGGAHPHHDHLHIELSVPAGDLQTPFFQEGLPPPTLSPCAPALAGQGGVIDSEGPCLALYGPARFWRSVEGEGYGGGLYWTNAFQNERPSNWARWRFSVSQSGRYALEVHSVPQYSVYPQVRYAITSADGVNEVTLNLAGQSGWVRLGEGRFEATGREFFVDVFDNYASETGSDQHIIVDALRVTSLSGPVEPPPGGAEPPLGGAEPPPGGAEPPPSGVEPPAGGESPPTPLPSAGGEEPIGGMSPSGRPIPPTQGPAQTPSEGGSSLPWETNETSAQGGSAGCEQGPESDQPAWVLALLALIFSARQGLRARRL